MITLQINGKPVVLEEPIALLAYIEQLGVNPRAIAVEHNGEIIERAAYERVTLKEGDTVEIVRMVGGGNTRYPLMRRECGSDRQSETRISVANAGLNPPADAKN